MADRDADEAVIPLIAMLVVLKLLPANLGSRTKDTVTGGASWLQRVLRNTAFYRITLAASSLTTLRCHCFHTFSSI